MGEEQRDSSIMALEPCLHQQKKCVCCGQIFTDGAEETETKRTESTTTDRRRRMSSGTFFGTFMKSIDETNLEEGEEKEEKVDDQPENEAPVYNDWSVPGKYSNLVKYSVNGVMKGQTRYSYDVDEKQPSSPKRHLSTDSGSSDPFEEDDENKLEEE